MIDALLNGRSTGHIPNSNDTAQTNGVGTKVASTNKTRENRRKKSAPAGELDNGNKVEKVESEYIDDRSGATFTKRIDAAAKGVGDVQLNAKQPRKNRGNRSRRNKRAASIDVPDEQNYSMKEIKRENGQKRAHIFEATEVKKEPEKESEEVLRDPTLLSDVLFVDHPHLHPNSKRALTEVMGLKTMTQIQAKTYAAAYSGNDVLGRARTGTGKTLAFLIPSVERLLESAHYQINHNVGVLIISPTRELAAQIGDQASKLLTFHKGMTVQVIFGGTNMKSDVSQLKRGLPTILVATPGRLLDHMQSTNVNGRLFGTDIMSGTRIVVLDETDRLLDMGFSRDIFKILAYLPHRNDRQTLLFSATMPQELRKIMSENMRSDFVEASCVEEHDAASHTNVRVEQSFVILPNIDRYVISVVEIVRLAMLNDPEGHKIVAFWPTARLVGYFAELFNHSLKIPVFEIHSRKSQPQRTKASDAFRNAASGILFTSDVSARGVDYPDVTQVIQIGIPESKDQYIHRLGRTGRAGKMGKGVIVLLPFEAPFVKKELKSHKIPEDSTIAAILNKPAEKKVLDMVEPVLSVGSDDNRNLKASAEQAYRAFLGYYVGQTKRTDLKSKEEVVSYANQLSKVMGLAGIPSLEKKTVGKMGLKGVPGLNISLSSQESRGGGRGRGGRGGSRNSIRY